MGAGSRIKWQTAWQVPAPRNVSAAAA